MESSRTSRSQRLTRRDLFKLSAVVGVPLLVACAPSAPPAPTSAPAAPAPTSAPAAKPAAPTAVAPTPAPATASIKRGGTLVQAKQWTYASLDPHLTSEPEMSGYEGMYNGLVRFELVNAKTWEHKVVPDLAESWEQTDPKKRHEVYRQVLKRVQDQAYLFSGIAMPLLTAYRKEVQGLTPFEYQSPSARTAWFK